MRILKPTATATVTVSLMFLLAVTTTNVLAVATNDNLTEKTTNIKTQKIRTTWTDADRAIMKAADEKLAIDMPAPGLTAGNKAPNFKLTNAFGKTIELQQELAKGPVVLIFYRGAWCPYCNLHLQALKSQQTEFAKYDAQVIAISPQLPDKSAAQVKKEGFPFEVLSDSSAKVMKDYKLYFELPTDLMRVYKEHGLDIEDFNGQGRNGLPTPGAFVIDKKGIIRTMQAEVDYKTRMSPEDIISALAKL
jgi:peroxiredoxin